MKGDHRFFRELLDRIDGPVGQELKLEHGGGLTIKVEYVDSLDPAPEAAPGPGENPA